MDYFTVYKITNVINGKYYIGKHVCGSKCRHRKEYFDGVCCAYMGSGASSKGGGFKAAKEKYGIENFKKEILFVFETEKEMNDKEAELVTEDLITSGSVYNLCPGGQGGWGYINIVANLRNGFEKNPEKQKDYSVLGISKLKTLIENDFVFRKDFGEKISKSLKGKSSNFKGKIHTEETKAKMRKSKNGGNKNSQFGSMWITNGTENRKVKKDLDIIPEGWYKGRKLRIMDP